MLKGVGLWGWGVEGAGVWEFRVLRVQGLRAFQA